MDKYYKRMRILRKIVLWLIVIMFFFSESVNEKMNQIMMFLLFSEICSISDK